MSYQGKVQECAGDQGKLFKFTETLFKNSKVSSLPEHTSLHELTSRFNNFFMNKISTIRSKLEASDAGALAVCVESPFSGDRMTQFELASTSEISKIIKASKKATCSLDPVPTNLLADHYLDTLLPTLTNLVNRSLMTGTFPEELKHALVRPLLKKPSLDANILNNFRPVSNLAFISKVIERAVASRLYDHMSANNLHEIFQSAFKPCHSTETALLRVHNDILRAVDNKKAVYLILLDLSDAFDTIDHNVLISYLKNHIGIQGVALDWFISYLTDRKQSVFIDGIASLLCVLLFGVPQGSVLGPLLFCIYILPLGQILKKHGIMFLIYADDTQIYISFSAADRTAASDSLLALENCILAIRSWMGSNKLKLNDDKNRVLGDFLSSPPETVQGYNSPNWKCQNFPISFCTKPRRHFLQCL